MNKQEKFEQTIIKEIEKWNPICLSNPQNNYFDIINDIIDLTTYKSAKSTIARAIRKSVLVTYGKQFSSEECAVIAENIKSQL